MSESRDASHSTKGANQADLGGFNQRVVADAIRRSGDAGISRTQLAAASNLSPQAITNVVRRLLDAGFVRESGQVWQGSGKPRTLLTLDPNGAFAIGVHIDPSVVNVIVLDATGEIRARSERRYVEGESPADTLQAVAELYRGLLASTKIDPARVVGVGVAAPGPIDRERETLVAPPLMREWDGVPLVTMLEELVQLPVVLIKDVAAGASGEMWLRRYGEAGSFLFCYLGTGMGISTVINGVLQAGVSGNAGEVGPRLDDDLQPITAGDRFNYVGMDLSPTFWVLQAKDVGLTSLPGSPPWPPNRLNFVVEQLVDAALHGDERAKAIFVDAGASLGHSLAVFSDLFDVNQVVIGGPIWDLVSSILLPQLAHELQRLPALASVRPVTVMSCQHGKDVTAIGAASHALQSMMFATNLRSV